MLTREFQRIMTEYNDAVAELQKNRRPFDGVLGLGNHPGNAACHEVMDRQVEELCRQAGAEETPAEQAALLQAIYAAQGQWTGPEYARMMLAAIQRHTLPLIPNLNAGDRENLRSWYEKEFPRRKRLPVQDQILKALKA